MTLYVLHRTISVLSPEFNVLRFSQEKEYNMESEKRYELFQTQWRKHVEKVTIPPKQTPVYLAVNKGPTKKKQPRNGESLLKLDYRCV